MRSDNTIVADPHRLVRELFAPHAQRVLEPLSLLREQDLHPILMNLPWCYDREGSPSDIDLMLGPAEYSRAWRALSGSGYRCLPGAPDPSQVVLVRYLDGGVFARVHLHRDFEFWGIPLTCFDDCVRHCTESRIGWLLSPEADYWLLTAQWFLRKKWRYADRLQQMEHVVQGELLHETAERLFGPRVGFMEHLDQLRISSARVSSFHQATMLVRFFGLRPGVLHAIWSKAMSRVGWPTARQPRGKAVFLMGTDGSGKSTIAQNILRINSLGGPPTTSFYLGLKKTFVQRCLARFRAGDAGARSGAPVGLVEKLAGRSMPLANLANLVLSLLYLTDYLFRTRQLRRAVARGEVALVDRSYYDRLAAPLRWGDRLLFMLLPKPDLIIGLTAEPSVLAGRKDEYEASALASLQELQVSAWKWTEGQGVKVMEIDTTDVPLDDVTTMISARVWHLFSRQLKHEGEEAL